MSDQTQAQIPDNVKNGIFCLLQHMRTFNKQARENEIANFSEPCEKCDKALECKFDWLKITFPCRDIFTDYPHSGSSGAPQ